MELVFCSDLLYILIKKDIKVPVSNDKWKITVSRIFRYFANSIVLVLLSSIIILIVYLCVVVMSIFTDRDFVGKEIASGTSEHFFQHFGSEWRRPTHQAKSNELRQSDIYNNHNTIINWVLDCTGAKEPDVFAAPIRNDFVLGYFFNYESSNDVNKLLPQEVRIPSHIERAVLTLSKEIASQRQDAAQRADSAYSLWQLTSIITIVLGLFTTILVSLSSTEFGRGDSTIPRAIRILAIVFPALGTASAAVVAFYGPQADWAQASRTLTSLTQLHDQIATGVWNLKCMRVEGDDDEKKIKTQLDEWSRRYIDIQTVSNATGGSSTTSDQAPKPPGDQKKGQ